MVATVTVVSCRELVLEMLLKFLVFQDKPNCPNLDEAVRLMPLIILDSYSLFDRKREGEWRIIAHQKNFEPVNVKKTFFVYGANSMKKRVDIWGNIEDISDAESKQYPDYSPCGDWDVQELVELFRIK